jgi:Acyl dehydratase
MEIGQIVFDKKLHLTRDSLVRYAGASGDFNPIHYRDDIAKQVGLPGVLAHGMLTMGAAISPLFDEQGLTVVDYSVRFSKPVVVDAEAGAELNLSAEVVELDGNRAKLAIKAVFNEQTVMAKSFAWVENAKT